MQEFVAGATGVLGRRLVDRLADRDHDVVGLVRDDAGERTVRDAGGDPVRGDLLEPGTIDAAVPDSVDAVVHAATSIPTETKTSLADWETNDRLRREGTETLTDAAAAAGADRYLQQSVVWLARQQDGGTITEDSDPNPDPITESALDGERIARQAGETHGFATVVLRGGWFYGHDAAHTLQFGQGLLDRRLPVVGGGLLGREDAAVSLLHLDDAASAYVAAIEGADTGVYNVVDDQPVTIADLFGTFAETIGAPPPRRVPGWLARPLVGKHTVRFLTSPMPAENGRFKAAFDWEPAVPTYRDGIERIVERWRSNETIQEENGEVVWTG